MSVLDQKYPSPPSSHLWGLLLTATAAASPHWRLSPADACKPLTACQGPRLRSLSQMGDAHIHIQAEVGDTLPRLAHSLKRRPDPRTVPLAKSPAHGPHPHEAPPTHIGHTPKSPPHHPNPPPSPTHPIHTSEAPPTPYILSQSPAYAPGSCPHGPKPPRATPTLH